MSNDPNLVCAFTEFYDYCNCMRVSLSGGGRDLIKVGHCGEKVAGGVAARRVVAAVT